MQASVFISTTLDGFIARTDGSLDFLNKFPLKDEDFGFKDFMKNIDCVVMGRKTFEHMMSGSGMPYKVKVFVLSTTLKSVNVPNVEIVSLPPVDLMNKIAEEGLFNIYVQGANVIQSFLKDDLIEELTLTRIPLLIGSGISLFKDSSETVLELIESRAYQNGFTQSVYKID